MSAARIAELRQLIADSKTELMRLQRQLEAAVRRDDTWHACDLRGEVQLAADDHEALVVELKGLEAQEAVGQAVARGVRVADPGTGSGQFIDMLTAELMALSDDEVLEGQDPVELQRWGRALVARAKRTALIRRVVAELDEQWYRGLEWRYRDGKVQVGKAISVEYTSTDRQGIPRHSHGRPFTVWVDVPSLARVLAVKRAEERALADDELPF